VLIATLAFSLITSPFGLVLLMASKFVGVRFSQALRASAGCCSPRCCRSATAGGELRAAGANWHRAGLKPDIEKDA